MTQERKRWSDLARYDLDTARAMHESGRYLYVLFCCQQAVEKALKGLIAERTGKMPPRVHQLARLAEAAKLECGEERLQFFRKLSSYYIQTRYPEEMMSMAGTVSSQLSDSTLSTTEEVLAWLHSIR
jgi:HEPN domain-containing protein